MKTSVLFVHGAWVTSASWDNFRSFFEQAGYEAHTPAWPYLANRTTGQINGASPQGFGSLSLAAIADCYEDYIRSMPVRPIIVGHSFGGLVAQMLLDRGLGRAGVAISPAPIGGIVPGPSALVAITPALLRLNGWNRSYVLSRQRFGKLFANTAPQKVQDEAYERLAIPAPGRIFFEGSFWLGTWVDTRRRRQPLLITGAEHDRLVSPYLAHAAFRRQRRSAARTDYKLFASRSHFLIGEPGWEDVAQFILDWTESLASTAPETESGRVLELMTL